MSKGRIFHDPQFRYIDNVSNREILRLTDYLGHSNHFYFTDPCWFNHNRSFLFTSDRENQSNLFRYDLDGGKITQVTDLQGKGRPGGCVSEVNNAVYFWWQNDLIELKLDTLAERIIRTAERPMLPAGRANPTADGQYICTMLVEEQPQDKPRVSFAYSRFVEFFETKPFTQIVRIDMNSGAQEVIHEDRRYMGHVNTSPALPNLLTYCHEGPWARIDQRIWGLDIHSGKTWKIRPQDGDNYAVGHEYWFADGERIGYHGRPRDGQGNHVFGHIKWDNSDHIEVNFPFHSTHFHSLDESMMVGDGTPAFRTDAQPYIQLFRWDGERYVGPRILAYHRSTFNDQHAHCHPRFTPDGKSILYTSDLTAYSNMYLVEMGDFEELPLMADVLQK
ncbi:MAG: PD40 domain-containing protein [Caldilineaceae bacterium]|nr:PD40 domain-containing protein [Caldilineaceae bacterium]